MAVLPRIAVLLLLSLQPCSAEFLEHTLPKTIPRKHTLTKDIFQIQSKPDELIEKLVAPGPMECVDHSYGDASKQSLVSALFKPKSTKYSPIGRILVTFDTGEDGYVQSACTGTLIDEVTVLTAAQCLHSPEYGWARKVVFNPHDLGFYRGQKMVIPNDWTKSFNPTGDFMSGCSFSLRRSVGDLLGYYDMCEGEDCRKADQTLELVGYHPSSASGSQTARMHSSHRVLSSDAPELQGMEGLGNSYVFRSEVGSEGIGAPVIHDGKIVGIISSVPTSSTGRRMATAVSFAKISWLKKFRNFICYMLRILFLGLKVCKIYTDHPTPAPTPSPSPSEPLTGSPTKVGDTYKPTVVTSNPSSSPTSPITISPSKAPATAAPTDAFTFPDLPPKVNDSAVRYFVIDNAGTQTIYPAFQGDLLPGKQKLMTFNATLTGFELLAGQSVTVELPANFSGRVWARTGCVWITEPGCHTLPALGRDPKAAPLAEICNNTCKAQGKCRIVCQTGNCGADNGLAGNLECGADSGAPATLAEFTVDSQLIVSNDFYDISNVDGYSNGIEFGPIPGRFTPAADIQGEYNCGVPSCDIKEPVADWCPKELQYYRTGYCLSICMAIEREPQRSFVDDTTTYTVQTATGAQSLTARKYLQYLYAATDWMHPNQTSGNVTGMMKDHLCARCGNPLSANASFAGKGCEVTTTVLVNNKTETVFVPNPGADTYWGCTYGCSPYVDNYPENWWNRRSVAIKIGGGSGEALPPNQTTAYPNWPNSTLGGNYAELYSQKCKNSYSWQFNDMASTFQCYRGD